MPSMSIPQRRPPSTITVDKIQYCKGATLGRGTFGEVVCYTNVADPLDCFAAKILLPKTKNGDGIELTPSEQEGELCNLKVKSKKEYEFQEACEGTYGVVAHAYHAMGNGFLITMELGICSLDVYAAKYHMSTKNAATLGIQLFTALDYIKSRSIIHADIKPGNLVLFPMGRVKLCDYGFAFNYKATPKIGHIGSRAYSSVDNLTRKTLQPRDDEISACYSIMDLLLPLPWFGCGNKKLCLERQMQSLTGSDDAYFLKNILVYLLALNVRSRTTDRVQNLLRQYVKGVIGGVLVDTTGGSGNTMGTEDHGKVRRPPPPDDQLFKLASHELEDPAPVKESQERKGNNKARK